MNVAASSNHSRGDDYRTAAAPPLDTLPVVLDCIVSAAWQELGYLCPSVAKLGMLLDYDTFLQQ